MMWTYNGIEFTSEMIDEHQGFIYLITEKDTNMKYIGKKNFYQVRKLKPLKGKTRRRIVKSETDWKTYYGSSEALGLLLEKNGTDNYTREILKLCRTKGEMSYFETKEQFDREVLLRSDYHNGIIACRINHNHVNHLKK